MDFASSFFATAAEGAHYVMYIDVYAYIYIYIYTYL